MARTAEKREESRTRKQRQRDRERERNRQKAADLAIHQEAQSEDLAPRVLREAIMATGGYGMILGPRVVVVNGRAVHAYPGYPRNPVEGVRYKDVTKRHQEAAQRFQQDWADVGAGCGATAVDYARARSRGGSPAGENRSMLAQIDIRDRLDLAFVALGNYGAAVCRVVIDCIPISVWAEERKIDIGVAVQFIVMGLDLLVAHYFPETISPGSGKLMGFGPARVSYSTKNNS